MELLPNILTAIPCWPIVALVIVLAFMFTFKKEIAELLAEVKELTFPGGKAVFAYGQASRDRLEQEQPSKLEARPVAAIEQPQTDSIKWSNSGNLFWAAHDLMLTIDRLLRNAPSNAIFFTLQQSLWHIRALGFEGQPIESKLTKLTAKAAEDLKIPYPVWPPDLRDYYATELESIKNEIGFLARANQPDFNPGPKVDFPTLRLHE